MKQKQCDEQPREIEREAARIIERSRNRISCARFAVACEEAKFLSGETTACREFDDFAERVAGIRRQMRHNLKTRNPELWKSLPTMVAEGTPGSSTKRKRGAPPKEYRAIARELLFCMAEHRTMRRAKKLLGKATSPSPRNAAPFDAVVEKCRKLPATYRADSFAVFWDCAEDLLLLLKDEPSSEQWFERDEAIRSQIWHDTPAGGQNDLARFLANESSQQHMNFTTKNRRPPAERSEQIPKEAEDRACRIAASRRMSALKKVSHSLWPRLWPVLIIALKRKRRASSR